MDEREEKYQITCFDIQLKQKRINDLEDNIKKCSSFTKSLQNKLSEEVSKNGELQREISRLKDSSENLDREMSELRNHHEHLSKEYQLIKSKQVINVQPQQMNVVKDELEEELFKL